MSRVTGCGATWRARRQAGFTLIEIMVALVVVGLALPALLLLVMSQLGGTAAVRDKTFAYWVAENELTRLRLQQALLPEYRMPDELSGRVQMAEREWAWNIDTEATDFPGFRRMELRVTLVGRQTDHLASVLGFVHD